MADDTTGTSKDDAEPTGGEQSSAEASGPDAQAQRAAGGTAPTAGEEEQAPADVEGAEVSGTGATPEGGTRTAAPASRERQGMFGVTGSGDTSGFGGLRLPGYAPAPAERPFGGWFDEFADDLAEALAERDVPRDSVQQITIDRGEITFYVRPERVLDICRTLRDDEGLRFELCSSVSGVDYGEGVPQRLHVAYHLTSMTYRRRIRLEVALDVEDPRVTSVVEVYPTADWHERECWDMFGVVFEGHPALTRILMPDDWEGHPQRKDYPLGGIPVEYKGAEIPPPDERRSYS
ncbi:NADH-quinone oxidoreductase subunit C [Pseudonocardia sp. KRD-184]|uniref:NADH-quinone oxidoreductase subunit C n=1 Tax=Pseudonocardia oceani TaxID=2792013 RepID=A0ABS6U794_9PSEU|nr:NADH-quinone oxidoreductase subunit C [Pseudonocardia oceani]MBW0091772.1 NADH-quinone oxidoreductase subunit C [Pseudonocardia oceani]MBW0099065.1 NADH-quinone oxidoreductase subunit C [Pseudonocardia oceani]MBW0111381.1 NADH-quinone oxidoreductase subunit C [Pseudonocardia oceani]MBW0120886.1 NADH-quinone oxidoreductase subunit C [Pseudonocardia oceani]MBW0128097.1 NADH-quinone oxidoreductase subunit C [Pseudonocardia oceani]